jgi:hypothetical protein
MPPAPHDRPFWRFLVLGCATLAASSAAAQNPIDFRRDIQPILQERCYKCHGTQKEKGDLRLDVKARAFKGGESGPVIVPGKAKDSLLYRLIAGLDPDRRMPPPGPGLPPEQAERVRAWLDAGAPWPDEAGAIDPRKHWAFLPPCRPPVPAQRPAWANNPIDAFVAARHEAMGLVAAPEAARRVLIRRVTLDLTGLPPTAEAVEAFLVDPAPDAYAKVVDRLLASPRYGERWGRHWLDLARFAETEGYEGNTFRASVWRYRDYVVQSFNRDRPHDEFLRQQLAGDEIEPYADENLIATGFLSSARYSHNEEDKAVQRNDVLVDIANATAGVTLGLTLACAQCHDHKFDPVTAWDYYRWQGFFVRGQLVYALLKDKSLWDEHAARASPELRAARQLRDIYQARAEAKLTDEARKKLTPAARQLRDTPEKFLSLDDRAKAAALRKDVEKALPDDERPLYRELTKRLDKLEAAHGDTMPQMWAFYSPASSPHAVDMLPPKGDYPLPYDPARLRQTRPRLLKRGDVHQAKDELDPGCPEVLGPATADFRGPRPRLALADWLTGPDNPLTARVWVNYVWQQHFGRGLVATPGDFGTQGAPPTHPELLDWLATELVAGGWSTKHLHRLIVTSRTYRQASQPHAGNARRDPDNRFLWRWSPRRLEAEALRDAALAVSGDLDARFGGPGVPPDSAARTVRRTLYLQQWRDDMPRVQALFDGPTANESCPRRHVSTVPLQPLYGMNNPFPLARAEALAARVRERAGDDAARQVEEAFVLALGRPPDERERASTARFRAAYSDDAAKALVHLCHALLNTNEFAYLE